MYLLWKYIVSISQTQQYSRKCFRYTLVHLAICAAWDYRFSVNYLLCHRLDLLVDILPISEHFTFLPVAQSLNVSSFFSSHSVQPDTHVGNRWRNVLPKLCTSTFLGKALRYMIYKICAEVMPISAIRNPISVLKNYTCTSLHMPIHMYCFKFRTITQVCDLVLSIHNES